MSARRLVERPPARRDILEMVSYLAEHSAVAAANLYSAYEETLRMLREHPEAGRRYLPTHPALANLRMSLIPGFHDYMVFTRYDGETLEIVRVLHGARNIMTLFEDDSE